MPPLPSDRGSSSGSNATSDSLPSIDTDVRSNANADVAAEVDSSEDDEVRETCLTPGFANPGDIPSWSIRQDGPLPIWTNAIPLKQSSGSKNKAVYVVFRSKRPGIYYNWYVFLMALLFAMLTLSEGIQLTPTPTTFRMLHTVVGAAWERL